ncbi:hypothetical protein IFM53868_08954 [Aspergillus udagawae]|uniref:Uncharacterized protein n=1 Tax=Aspergillus udagawae TaxID=91492 RepID=A0ABQ1BA65_9EURO|nr:hypothetical protein IFM53868_08954 [Aspergillus udagawae]
MKVPITHGLFRTVDKATHMEDCAYVGEAFGMFLTNDLEHLSDIIRNVEWAWRRDGQPAAKPVSSSVQHSAIVLYRRGIEVDGPCEQWKK